MPREKTKNATRRDEKSPSKYEKTKGRNNTRQKYENTPSEKTKRQKKATPKATKLTFLKASFLDGGFYRLFALKKLLFRVAGFVFLSFRMALFRLSARNLCHVFVIFYGVFFSFSLFAWRLFVGVFFVFSSLARRFSSFRVAFFCLFSWHLFAGCLFIFSHRIFASLCVAPFRLFAGKICLAKRRRHAKRRNNTGIKKMRCKKTKRGHVKRRKDKKTPYESRKKCHMKRRENAIQKDEQSPRQNMKKK